MVLFKLILFAVLMAVVPIGTYFSTLKYFAKGTCTRIIIDADFLVSAQAEDGAGQGG